MTKGCSSIRKFWELPISCWLQVDYMYICMFPIWNVHEFSYTSVYVCMYGLVYGLAKVKSTKNVQLPVELMGFLSATPFCFCQPDL